MTNVAKRGRARLQVRLGAPFLDLDLSVQASVTGYSEGHIRQVLKGQQIGEPFIAAVLAAFPHIPFERQFELVPAVHEQRTGFRPLADPAAAEEPVVTATEDAEDAPMEALPPEGFPRSYGDAVANYGLEPEPGPPLFPGADDREPDRIVWREGDVPVLAFEPGAIRTYAITRDHEPSMQLLAYYGHETWTGNRIRI